MASYGYMGDLLRISEKLRWLGPARYNYAGALVMALGLSYEAHVSYLPAHRLLPCPSFTPPFPSASDACHCRGVHVSLHLQWYARITHGSFGASRRSALLRGIISLGSPGGTNASSLVLSSSVSELGARGTVWAPKGLGFQKRDNRRIVKRWPFLDVLSEIRVWLTLGWVLYGRFLPGVQWFSAWRRPAASTKLSRCLSGTPDATLAWLAHRVLSCGSLSQVVLPSSSSRGKQKGVRWFHRI